MEALWPIITIAGPILFVVVLAWVVIRSRARGSAAVEARADRGARDVYAEEDRRSDD